MNRPLTVTRLKLTYRARFYGGVVRTFKAVNEFQAQRIAAGLARSNNWKIESLGRA